MKRVLKRVGQLLLAGLLAILPLVLTVVVVGWATGFLVQYVGPASFVGRALGGLGLTVTQDSNLAYVLGWVVVLVVVLLLGLAVEKGAKRFLQRMFDRALMHIPLVKSLYGTSKQLVGMFEKSEGDHIKAMTPVFCRFGSGEGPRVLALMPTPERFLIQGREHHVVIVPTAPVPVGGALLFLPVDQVEPSNLSVDAATSIYVSMGITAPQFLGEHAQALQQARKLPAGKTD